MRILALDISKASTGVAIGDGTGPPRSFVVSFPGPTRGHVGAKYAKWLRDILIMEKPALVAFEAAFIKLDKKGSVEATKMLLSLNFLTETLCAMRSIPGYPVAAQTWRKVFLGHGYPHDPKKASLNMCATLGWETDGVDDRAEACGVLVWAHYNHGDRRAIMRALSASSMRAMGA